MMAYSVSIGGVIAGLCGLILFSMPGCQSAVSEEDGAFKVAVAHFSHETCTFCPGEEADIDAWTRSREPYSGEELLEEGGSYIRGFTDRTAEYEDVHPVGLTSPAGVWADPLGPGSQKRPSIIF